jgi:hypothetical protein
MSTRNKEKSVIGSSEYIVIGRRKKIPAKIDTGADRSAIYASNIEVHPDNTLTFSLFGENSPFYTGKLLKRKKFGVAKVKSSNGGVEYRYRTHITITLANRKIRATFYLSDRSKHRFPVLIGRRTLRNKYLVDVSKAKIKLKTPKVTNRGFKQSPYNFHRDYIKIETGVK